MARSTGGTVLGAKHWEALRLINEGQMSLKKIASTIGVSADYLYDLHEGNTEKTGSLGALFVAELRKNEAKDVSKIKSLLSENKKLSLQMINEFLRRKNSQRSRSDEDVKLVVCVFNALAKAGSGAEGGSAQWNHTKGLTVEELMLEFNRLRSLAEGSSQRKKLKS